MLSNERQLVEPNERMLSVVSISELEYKCNFVILAIDPKPFLILIITIMQTIPQLTSALSCISSDAYPTEGWCNVVPLGRLTLIHPDRSIALCDLATYAKFWYRAAGESMGKGAQSGEPLAG